MIAADLFSYALIIFNGLSSFKTILRALFSMGMYSVSLEDIIKFPSIKLLKYLNNNNSMFETILTSANDQLVDFFMQNKIKYLDINKYLNKIINLNEFKPYFKKKPKDLNQIIKLSTYVKLKTKLICDK